MEEDKSLNQTIDFQTFFDIEDSEKIVDVFIRQNKHYSNSVKNYFEREFELLQAKINNAKLVSKSAEKILEDEMEYYYEATANDSNAKLLVLGKKTVPDLVEIFKNIFLEDKELSLEDLTTFINSLVGDEDFDGDFDDDDEIVSEYDLSTPAKLILDLLKNNLTNESEYIDTSHWTRDWKLVKEEDIKEGGFRLLIQLVIEQHGQPSKDYLKKYDKFVKKLISRHYEELYLHTLYAYKTSLGITVPESKNYHKIQIKESEKGISKQVVLKSINYVALIHYFKEANIFLKDDVLLNDTNAAKAMHILTGYNYENIRIELGKIDFSKSNIREVIKILKKVIELMERELTMK